MVPTLRLYAFLADGERGALIGPEGDVAWMCMPSWEGEAIFTGLLGGRGAYVIRPAGRFVWGGYYEADSLIWRNRWVLGDGGIVESREALAFPGKPDKAVLLRHVLALKGSAKLRVCLDPWNGYGTRRLGNFNRSEQGVWAADSDGLYARWTGAAKADWNDQSGLVMELELQAGDEQDLVLEFSSKPLNDPPPDPQELWKATESGWNRAMPRQFAAFPQRDLRLAYAVLRGLTSSSGGMAAAATTSLPERAETIRDYDYRYAWIRDQCWMGQALALYGPHTLLENTLRFVIERILSDGPQTRPVYTTSGKPVPSPRRIENLPGYPGTIRVVAGNKAGAQFQLDIFGEMLLLFAAAAEHDLLDAEGWKAAEVAAQAISQRWREQDAGVWELENRRWTHSSLMCAAGLRRISLSGAPSGSASRWLALADSITAETAVTCIHPSGRWKRAQNDDRVDASLLLPMLRGLFDNRDPRSLETLATIEKDLLEGGYCHRFRTDLPLGRDEGAFTVCNFWLALEHLQLGDTTGAARFFERARSSCSASGIFTEEYDVVQRELRGNFPQAFVHALLLECAARMNGDL